MRQYGRRRSSDRSIRRAFAERVADVHVPVLVLLPVIREAK